MNLAESDVELFMNVTHYVWIVSWKDSDSLKISSGDLDHLNSCHPSFSNLISSIHVGVKHESIKINSFWTNSSLITLTILMVLICYGFYQIAQMHKKEKMILELRVKRRRKRRKSQQEPKLKRLKVSLSVVRVLLKTYDSNLYITIMRSSTVHKYNMWINLK